ncbi:Uncharacterised protein [Sebaldella termitidis]|uniref:Uncharacterized protein n=1 Tax=Sebaldella termitidis (strain ATCC 33386 / NCTC 11300) TaxID=526218 RepID=D1AN69_SEBTE|nr:hypothetical protein [Sebaldella termitidis]ACZ09673.1 hypothetical protein Sterm_2829 [Sebaldella termitidis ATCC 33386]SUI25005.1 Uncharacterised protein [Sebaldella termitidis]
MANSGAGVIYSDECYLVFSNSLGKTVVVDEWVEEMTFEAAQDKAVVSFSSTNRPLYAAKKTVAANCEFNLPIDHPNVTELDEFFKGTRGVFSVVAYLRTGDNDIKFRFSNCKDTSIILPGSIGSEDFTTTPVKWTGMVDGYTAA